MNYTVISAFNDKETDTLIEPGSLYPADQKRASVLRAAGVISEDDEGQALSKQTKSTDSDKDKDAPGGDPDADDTPKS
ncbi:hypothetical protein HUB98_26450 [Paenibacillus barcinonensis]|uniref:Uncharacterized protein n=1 Tax=Paenibacillus barcinonensis TaxID=198119 RepID=A0ABX6QB30_PAEBA|nr:hypothetical protein [Paenibacillus barcinonensis]QKS59394.1 hypothetical protein HUB98_26450 [Paenibacillus barcinonensis]